MTLIWKTEGRETTACGGNGRGRRVDGQERRERRSKEERNKRKYKARKDSSDLEKKMGREKTTMSVLRVLAF